MQKADQKLDNLAVQVGNIENNVFSEDGAQVEVMSLLKSVHDVKSNYQNLRKDILEVQDLQKKLSSSLQTQLRLMQTKCEILKEKLCINTPQSSSSEITLSDTEEKGEDGGGDHF